MTVPTPPDGGHTQAAEASPPNPDRAPALAARLWWLSAVRGLVALVLAFAVIMAGRGTSRLLTFLGLYWMVGGLITLRFALAIRPRRGTRLALAAGMAAVVGAVRVLLRDLRDDLVHADLPIGLLGVSAVLTGLLRVLGGFAAERQFGRRWTIGGLGTRQ